MEETTSPEGTLLAISILVLFIALLAMAFFLRAEGRKRRKEKEGGADSAPDPAPGD